MAVAYAADRAPHPVEFDIAYPERLSRWRIFIKWLFAIPQLIVVYLLTIVAEILTFLAWFAVLITGRYPKSFFEFTSGALRWQANVYAYLWLLRDEYPPFSWEPGEYPLTLTIPPAERQSRFRLFIRIFAVVPNLIALEFVLFAAFFTTFIAWWAILFTARYPRALFRFAVGALRWHERMMAYLLLLRDEYPPYSVKASARPGNEVVSAIVGAPLFAAYIALSLLPFITSFTGGGSTTHVAYAALAEHRLVAAPASAESSGLHVELVDFVDPAPAPSGSGAQVAPGERLVRFRVTAEKEGFWPTFFTPYLFVAKDCSGTTYSVNADATSEASSAFRIFWSGGREDADVYFAVPVNQRVCELRYGGGFGRVIRFVFD